MVALRDQFGASMSSFRSGFQDRFGVGSRISSINAGGDSRLTPSEFYAAIEDSRTAHDKFGFVSGLTEQAVIHRVQDGFGFDAQTGNPDCNKFLNEYIQEWCETPEAFDIAGENDWATSQQLCETAVIRDVDYWYLGLDSGHVQLIESHRVRSSNWVRGSSEKGRKDGTTEHLGVICDSQLKRLGVRVTKNEARGAWTPVKLDDLETFQVRDSEGVRQVFHAHDSRRSSMTRATGSWWNLIEATNMLDQGKFSLLVKTVLAASLAYIHTKKKGNASLEFGDTDPTLAAAMKAAIEKVNPGGVVEIEEGEKLEMLSTNLGASEAIALIDLLMQELSLVLGIPLAVGVLDGNKLGNFTSGRMTWDLAKIGIRKQRVRRAKQIAIPLREWKLHWLLRQPDSNRDAVKARAFFEKVEPRKFFWARVKMPGWPYPQPMDEHSANALAISTFQNSHRRVLAAAGHDLIEVAPEMGEDRYTIGCELAKWFAKFRTEHSATIGDFTFKDFIELGLYRGTQLPRENAPAANAPARDQKANNQ